MFDAKVHHEKKTIRVTTVHFHSHSNGFELWHRQLGHVGRETARSMPGRYVKVMDLIVCAQSENYEPCLLAKQMKSPSTGRLAQPEKEHVLHSDFGGPIQLQTIGKSCHMATFFVGRYRFAKF